MSSLIHFSFCTTYCTLSLFFAFSPFSYKTLKSQAAIHYTSNAWAARRSRLTAIFLFALPQLLTQNLYLHRCQVGCVSRFRRLFFYILFDERPHDYNNSYDKYGNAAPVGDAGTRVFYKAVYAESRTHHAKYNCIKQIQSQHSFSLTILPLTAISRSLYLQTFPVAVFGSLGIKYILTGFL